MKKALNIILIYIISCVIGTVLLAALFMLNMDLMSYVTDTKPSLFSLEYFLYGLSISFPFAASFAIISVIFFMVRSMKNQFPCLLAYILTGAFTWLLFIPFSLKSVSSFEAQNINPRVNETSSGIFREGEAGIFYYSRILEDNKADGIFIDTDGQLESKNGIEMFYDEAVNNEDAYPFSDVLIKNSMQPPKYVTYPLAVYTALLTAAENMNSQGFLEWLCFATLGLALLSVYGVQFFSGWKLFSVFSVIIISILIVFINYFYYMGFFPPSLMSIDSMLSVFPGKNPLIVLINILITLVLAIYGTFMGIYRIHRFKSSSNGEN